MDAKIQEISYNDLLMNHLNRLSAVTTSSFIDVVSSQEQHLVELGKQRPSKIGETALQWGVQFLYSIVPSDWKDQKMRDDYSSKWKEAKAEKDKHKWDFFPPSWQFTKIRIMTDLLQRRGLLTPEKVISRAFKPKNTKEDHITMEFEDE